MAVAGARTSLVSGLVLVLVLGLAVPAGGSEFPERECCDSIPPLPAQFTTPPVSVGTSSPRAPSITHSTTAVQTGTVSPMIDCKTARQMCVNDQACHSITTLIPRLCGQELVACSTVTVIKCRAALRTLVAFQFFQPTCLCKERRIDPECHTYQSLLFDHPCFTVKQKDNDPYLVHALPTCHHALDTCRGQGHCSRLYDNFVRSCAFRDDRCLMTNSRVCYDAWNELRLSPVFGCMCPDSTDQCLSIFNMVHRNPCVDDLPEHRRNASWHSTHYRLHRLLLPAGSSAAWRRPYAPALPAPPAPRTPARSRTVASSQSWPGTSPRRVSVDVLGGGALDGSRRPTDPRLVTPLFDLTSEPAANATVAQTLYGRSHPYGQHRRLTEVHVRRPQDHHAAISDTPSGDDVFRSTCHEARRACLADAHCRSKLQPVLSACREQNCDRNICMQRLQNFYRAANTNLSMEVAFCVCRSDGSERGECQSALEELHPMCAQRPAGGVLPACHSVAGRCRNDPTGACRSKLERYDLSCAVGSVTGLCAGPTSDCRTALLAVLGTELRTSCACRGTDITSMNECLSWERLLFANPCVVQAQREFHHWRQEQLRTTSPRPLPPPTPVTRRPTTTTTTTRWWRQSTTSTARSTPRRTTTPRPSTTARRGEEAAHCRSPIPGRAADRIPVGEGLRYYSQGEVTGRSEVESDCSEICMCRSAGTAICNVLECAARRECHTDIARYHDGNAALVAYREGCVCFHGNFICMRPPPERYVLSFGVFLFLGYSRSEEELLNVYTEKTVADHTVQELTRVLERITRRDQLTVGDGRPWPCNLTVKRQFVDTENIIIQAKLDDVEDSYNNSLSEESLNREKRECARPLRDISFMINNREPAILSHPLLSVFKVADVVVTIPDTSAARRTTGAARLVLVVTAAAALLVR